MDEPLFLRGRTRRLMLAGGRLYVQQLDGRPVNDFGIGEIARVGTVLGEDCLRECIWFVSPDVSVEGVTLHHNPYVLDVDTHDAQQMSEFTTALFDVVFERRRVPAPARTSALRTMSGVRLDLQAHMAKAPLPDVGVEQQAGYARMVDHYLRDAESVLGVGHTDREDTFGLVVLTSRRMLLVQPENDYVGDFLLQGLTRFYVEDHPQAGMRLVVDNSYVTSTFPMRDRPHAEFLAEQGMAAIDAMVQGGSVRAPQPSSVELFDAFELLVERRKLGMVGDDDFAWQLQGLFTALAAN